MKQGNCYSRRKFIVFFLCASWIVTNVVPLPLLAVSVDWIVLPPLPLVLLPNRSICDMHIRHVCQCHVDTRPVLYRWMGGKNRFNESKAINHIPTTHTQSTDTDNAQLNMIQQARVDKLQSGLMPFDRAQDGSTGTDRRSGSIKIFYQGHHFR